MKKTNNPLSFFEWKMRVQYGLVAVGSFTRGNYGPKNKKGIDDNSFRPLYEDGLTPIEAVIESELNNN